jgi:hypothetical protein
MLVEALVLEWALSIASLAGLRGLERPVPNGNGLLDATPLADERPEFDVVDGGVLVGRVEDRDRAVIVDDRLWGPVEPNGLLHLVSGRRSVIVIVLPVEDLDGIADLEDIEVPGVGAGVLAIAECRVRLGWGVLVGVEDAVSDARHASSPRSAAGE